MTLNSCQRTATLDTASSQHSSTTFSWQRPMTNGTSGNDPEFTEGEDMKLGMAWYQGNYLLDEDETMKIPTWNAFKISPLQKKGDPGAAAFVKASAAVAMTAASLYL